MDQLVPVQQVIQGCIYLSDEGSIEMAWDNGDVAYRFHSYYFSSDIFRE